MITPEQHIDTLLQDIAKLDSELKEAQEEVKFFENAALTWKKSYGEVIYKLEVKLMEAEQTIDELQKELKELRNNSYDF